MIGRKSGALTVVEKLGRKLTCRCDCGNTRVVSLGDFRAGRIKSCGCRQSAIKPGQRFGRLTLLDNCEGYAMCLCACGQEVLVPARNLRNGHTRSCGCLRRGRRTLQKIWEEVLRSGLFPVCRSWGCRGSFPDFEHWAKASGWMPGKRLERIDLSRPFAPANCRFV
jgi:hypothetical protein